MNVSTCTPILCGAFAPVETCGAIYVLLGNGDGTFGTTTNFPVEGDRPFSIAVGDFNGDGESDLAVTNQGTNNISILLGEGDGTFDTSTNFQVGESPHYIAIGNFN